MTGSAVRFLESIRHLTLDRGGRLALTPIGLQSVRDGKRYTRELEDRRRLYFDGFTCAAADPRVLRRPGRGVPGRGGAGPADRGDGARLRAIPGAGGVHASDPDPADGLWPGGAVSARSTMPAPERDRFNLPEQVISPSLTGTPEQVYLPAYVVRAVDQGGVVGYLAYTQASQEADPEWSQVCSVAEEVATLVENEYQSGRDEGEEDAARRWVEKRFTGRFDIGWRGGLLVATIPADAFAGGGGDNLQPRLIGSFVRMGGWYFRVWCDDERLRRRALLDLTDSYLGARAKITHDAAAKRLARFGRQVGFGPLSPAEIGKLGRDAGRKALAAQLEKLAELPSPR